MNNMKKFLMYLLIIVVFFVFSKVLEDGLIKQMYKNINGTINSNLNYNGENINLDLEVTEAKATRKNGYVTLNVKNNTSNYIPEAYIKVDLYSKSNVLAITKYMEIQGLSEGEAKSYKLSFGGSYISKYDVSLSNDYPDKENIINVLGYEINTADIFGMDFSSYVNASSFKNFGQAFYESASYTVQSIPWWGWLWAWGIVVGVF